MHLTPAVLFLAAAFLSSPVLLKWCYSADQSKIKREACAIPGNIHMKYTLTIEADSASEMEDIAKAFSGLGGSAAPATKPVKKAAKQDEPKGSEDEEEETGEKISVEEFRKKIQGYFGTDKKKQAEVKALIAKDPYNASKVSKVDSSHYAAILRELKIA